MVMSSADLPIVCGEKQGGLILGPHAMELIPTGVNIKCSPCQFMFFCFLSLTYLNIFHKDFGYEFGGAGTSTNPCSDIFRGPNAFSESETTALEQFILNADADWLAYVTVHSYGQVRHFF